MMSTSKSRGAALPGPPVNLALAAAFTSPGRKKKKRRGTAAVPDDFRLPVSPNLKAKLQAKSKATSKFKPRLATKLKRFFGLPAGGMAVFIFLLALSSCASSITLSPDNCAGRARWAADWNVDQPARYFKIEKKVWAIGKDKTVYWRDLLAAEGFRCEEVDKVAVHLRMDPSDVLFSLLGLSRQTVEISGTWHNDGLLPDRPTPKGLEGPAARRQDKKGKDAGGPLKDEQNTQEKQNLSRQDEAATTSTTAPPLTEGDGQEIDGQGAATGPENQVESSDGEAEDFPDSR